jgi:hypothetical protein
LDVQHFEVWFPTGLSHLLESTDKVLPVDEGHHPAGAGGRLTGWLVHELPLSVEEIHE